MLTYLELNNIQTQNVRICKNKSLGIITLNRPKALNATNFEMVCAIDEALTHFANDSEIKHVAITSHLDRVFCAGGDVKGMYMAMCAGDLNVCATYFRAEYQLINRLATFSKPIYAFVDGICFGGGMGLSVHGAACIASENAQFSMPETTIGFFPDVGAAYFFNKLDNPAEGIYLALTGHRFNRDFAIRNGLATHAIDLSQWDQLIEQLAAGAFLDECSFDSNQGVVPLQKDQLSNDILAAFGQERLLDIIKSAPAHVLAEMRTKSPFSIAVTYEFIKRARGLSRKEVLKYEFSLAMNFVSHGEFKEGVRALLIDKDRAPKWRYVWKDHGDGDLASHDTIPEEAISKMFIPSAF